MSDDECSIPGTPPELMEVVNNASLDLLPTKSRDKYNYSYNRFMDYRKNKNASSFSENVVMAYFLELGSKMKSSTLWANYSMLKATLAIRHDVDISKYAKLRALLKRQADGYRAKKSKILTKEQINQFIQEAPDKAYLMIKVAVIFGISGACRMDELVKMTLQDIEELQSKLLVNIPDSKTHKSRSFVVNEIYLNIYRKYVVLRPSNMNNTRFFYKYTNGKGCRQVVGIHQFRKMPKIVATYLNLPNPTAYTGHCFRRSSATMLVDSGGDITSLKRLGGWKSSNVAEGYIEESLTNKEEVANKIFAKEDNQQNTPSTSFSVSPRVSPMANINYCQKNQIINVENNQQNSSSSSHIFPVFNTCTNCQITVNITNN